MLRTGSRLECSGDGTMVWNNSCSDEIFDGLIGSWMM